MANRETGAGMIIRKLFNLLRGQHPDTNDDGTVTTRFGDRIVPYEVTMTPKGCLRANVLAFMSQPRHRELVSLMRSIDWKAGDKPSLDRATGFFYSTRDLEKRGVSGTKPLGRIDVALEEDIFRSAAQLNRMDALFGDASHDNPICLDESTGRVYPANRPSETRGFVKLSGTVQGPAAK